MEPYVSVIIPCYNSSSFLPIAIKSVRTQVRRDLEIIVVDDGSTDHTMSVLETLAGADLRVLRQANSGPSAARNRGIRESRGKWIAFLDADCYWLPGKLESQLYASSSNLEPVGFSYTGSLLVDGEGQTLAVRPVVPRGCLVEDLVWGNLISTSSAMARRDALFAVGMFDETLRILGAGGFPTQTVLCANDRVAFGVIAAAFQSGLKVGRDAGSDLRVAGHDDHPLSRYTCPPLTTVAQNYNEIGRLAIELLLFKLGETSDDGGAFPENERILLSAEIMLRGSA